MQNKQKHKKVLDIQRQMVYIKKGMCTPWHT